MELILYKNTTIAHTVSGVGESIVLLHGFLENATMWNSLVTVLSKNYQVITIDLLGHGKSECLGYIHTMEDQAEMVYFVLEKLGVTSAIFMGHSMGGYIALAFQELYPDFLSGLVLLNSTADADSIEKKKNRTRAIAVVKKNYITFVSMAITNLFSESNREKLINKIELVKKEALKIPLQGIIAALEGMKIRKERWEIVEKIKFPLLFILGEQDPVLPFDMIKKSLEIRKIPFCAFPDGHMTHIENKTELAKVLNDFLNKNFKIN